MVKEKLKILIFIFIIIFISANQITGQSGNIEKQKSKLSELQNQISKLEKKLNSKSETERKSLSTLQQINNQILLLSRVIKKLVVAEKKKEKKISVLTREIKKLEKKINKLQTDYSKYIVWLYKYGDSSLLNSIFNSSSISQAVLRYKYLEKITKKNKEILNNLNTDKDNLSGLLKLSFKEKAELKKLIIRRKQEKNLYSKRKMEKEKLIVELRKDQKLIEEEIVNKRQNEIQIKTLIANLIERERARKAKLHEELAKGKNVKLPVKFDYSNFENFAQLEGKLNWPVNSGEIVRSFGENENKKLKTVTLNYGIDIETDKVAKVYSVAEGIVSVIDWIPGYGSVLIVTHKNNFRTVYGHLTDISVEEGDRVKAGDVLGYVSENLEGNILHFEIWNERNYQNPEKWLAKK